MKALLGTYRDVAGGETTRLERVKRKRWRNNYGSRRHFHGLGGAVGVILGVLVFFQQGHEFFPRVGGDQFFGATEIRVGLPTDRQVNISMILNNKR